jgi:hypothetical protein
VIAAEERITKGIGVRRFFIGYRDRALILDMSRTARGIAGGA